MSPKVLIKKVLAEETIKKEKLDDFIKEFIKTLHYSCSSYSYRKERKTTPKYNIGDYFNLFLMVGATQSLNKGKQKITYAVAKAFPDKILDMLPKKASTRLKVAVLNKYFRGAILPLLFAGGMDYNRSGGLKVGEASGQYGYIPSNNKDILYNYLENTQYINGKSFIDIGCGIGDKVLLIHMLQIPMVGHGIEYDYINADKGNSAIHNKDLPSYCFYCGKVGTIIQETRESDWYDGSYTVDVETCTTENCKNNLSKRRSKRHKAYKRKISWIVKGDAFKSTYEPYDRFYTFCPIADRKILNKFYYHIWETVPENALWLEVMTISDCLEQGKPHGAIEIGRNKVGTRLLTKKRGENGDKKKKSVSKGV